MLTGLQVCKEERPDGVSRHQSLSCKTDPHSVKKEREKDSQMRVKVSRVEPLQFMCVWQCVFHHRLQLKLRWVHEFQAMALLFFSLRGKQRDIPAHSECYQHSVFWLRSVFQRHSEFCLFSLNLTQSDTCSVILQELMFCLFVLSRWEMQEGAELEEEQKSMVEELQTAYFVSRCSPRLQHCPESDETPAKETQGET